MRFNLFNELILNQNKMTRIECLRARDDCGAWCDVFSLFIQLGIPPGEQTVLWDMANKRMGCKGLKAILVLLQENNNLKNKEI